MTSPASATSDVEIRELIENVVEASQLAPKARSIDIKPTVANLTSLAYENGLLPDALDELIDLVTTPNHLDQASLAAIIRNLYPATRVSRDVVLRVVACLGHGKLKPSLTLQAALLKWLIIVHHALESPQVLAQAYPVLFNLLDTAVTRPHLCHLLALITRRKHVRPFRIQAVLNLSRQTGNDPYLVGLLRVFKYYYPEIIVGDAIRGKASAFKHPDSAWRERLDEIQNAYSQLTQDQLSRPHDGFRVYRPLNRGQRSKAIPYAHTSQATENSVTLEEVESATSFIQNIEKLDLPNQLVAVLADPLLQKLLLLRPSDEASQRIANWLNSMFQDVIDGDADEGTLFDVLDILRDFVTSTKTLPPLVLNFFARFLKLWDGSGRRESLLEILSYAPLLDFQELHQHIYKPLESIILDNSAESQLVMLNLYRNLLHHWTSLLLSSDSVSKQASQSVAALIDHAKPLALAIAQTSPTVSSRSAILDFYESTVRLITDNTLKQYIRIELPASLLVYILLFSNSLAVVSRLCYVLACYKKGFETAMSTKARGGASGLIDSSSYDRDYVNLYNGFLMEICNCFWRGRAFSESDTNAHGCMVPRAMIAPLTTYGTGVDKAFSLASIFGLSHSPVLCLQSIQTVREMEEAEMEGNRLLRARHAGPVTQASLLKLGNSGGIQLSWPNYRINVLRGLSDKGLHGITELLKNTMTVLKNSMEGKTSVK